MRRLPNPGHHGHFKLVCEIGDNREILAGNSTESGAIYSPLIKGRVDPSEIRKIFSQRGVPGYYIQVWILSRG